MVTPEERITRLEAVREANSQMLREVLPRQGQILNAIEAARQESREMNEAARREAREETRALRQETHQLVDSARRDARNLFIAGIAIVSAWGAGLIGLGIAILQRLPT